VAGPIGISKLHDGILGWATARSVKSFLSVLSHISIPDLS
jgi:hypothetical protein